MGVTVAADSVGLIVLAIVADPAAVRVATAVADADAVGNRVKAGVFVGALVFVAVVVASARLAAVVSPAGISWATGASPPVATATAAGALLQAIRVAASTPLVNTSKARKTVRITVCLLRRVVSLVPS